MKIVLVGYMASGKSTIGKILANSLDIDFIDLDNAIAKEVGTSIPEIFKNKGELFFRKTETKVLEKLLNSNQNFILATGGGTPCYGNNMNIIQENSTYSFYLKLSIPVLVERIIKEKSGRPIVANIKDSDLPEFVGKHLFERSMYYAMAKKTIDCDRNSAEDIVNEIEVLLL
jgi:shikimate kinase